MSLEGYEQEIATSLVAIIRSTSQGWFTIQMVDLSAVWSVGHQSLFVSSVKCEEERDQDLY